MSYHTWFDKNNKQKSKGCCCFPQTEKKNAYFFKLYSKKYDCYIKGHLIEVNEYFTLLIEGHHCYATNSSYL